MIKVCKQCGIDFETSQSSRQFCSKKCCYLGKAPKKKTYLKCQECGKLWHPQRLDAKYCSLKCKNIAQSKRPSCMKGRRRPSLDKSPDRTCPVCFKVFRPKGEMNGKYGGKMLRQQVYCSMACWEVRNPPKEYSCLYCGKKFLRHVPSQYCGNDCYNGARRVTPTLPKGLSINMVNRDLHLVSDIIKTIHREENYGYSYNHG